MSDGSISGQAISRSVLDGERSGEINTIVGPGQKETAQKETRLQETRVRSKVGALPENVAGALAYVTFIPAGVFLLVEPYNKNRFVRFHSIQSVLLWAAGIVLAAGLKLSGLVLFHVPMLGPLLLALLWGMAGLAVILIWLVLVVKALQGETFELPVLGRFADWNADPS
jgi:uncharacterized membrane protein